MPTNKRGYKSGTRRSATGYHYKNKPTWHSSTSYNPTMYKTARNEIQWRVCSYRYIHNQFNGTGKVTAFSPTTANRWIKWVDSGARVYKFTNTNFCKFFGTQWNTNSPTACMRWMRQKFGNGIKGVARGKGNCWLVAATTNFTSRPFRNYDWH